MSSKKKATRAAHFQRTSATTKVPIGVRFFFCSFLSLGARERQHDVPCGVARKQTAHSTLVGQYTSSFQQRCGCSLSCCSPKKVHQSISIITLHSIKFHFYLPRSVFPTVESALASSLYSQKCLTASFVSNKTSNSVGFPLFNLPSRGSLPDCVSFSFHFPHFSILHTRTLMMLLLLLAS